MLKSTITMEVGKNETIKEHRWMCSQEKKKEKKKTKQNLKNVSTWTLKNVKKQEIETWVESRDKEQEE
jgi:hypothetical protein